MKRWTAITYREFYDIPRIFFVRDNHKLLLFDCPFDSVEGEYGKMYKVYLMPPLMDNDLKGSWENIAAKAERYLGDVSASDVEFDSTRRREINAAILDRFKLGPY
jgi:hypothetical protein